MTAKQLFKFITVRISVELRWREKREDQTGERYLFEAVEMARGGSGSRI
jgi:hypothetical protein